MLQIMAGSMEYRVNLLISEPVNEILSLKGAKDYYNRLTEVLKLLQFIVYNYHKTKYSEEM